MNSEQLMIGDLVMNKETKGYVRISLNTFKFCENWDRYEPIPLTSSILELNGIKPTKHCDLSKPCWTMGIKNADKNAHIEMTFRSVHELQHALHLCGLNDLADSFKVI